MFTVGLDVHQSRSSLCILDALGKVVRQQEVKGHPSLVVEALRKFKAEAKEPFQVCFEASTGYGVLHDSLAPLAARVAVAHPGKLRLIFQCKKKNNRVDAAKLASILHLGQVPEVHVPAQEVRSWRGFIEYRRSLVDKMVAVKNQLRGLLRGLGIKALPGKGQWTKAGVEWLRAAELPTAFDRSRREILLDELESLQGRIAKANGELDEFAKGHAGVALLRTVPGVGPRTAEAFVAYVDDPHRFKSNTIGSYLGLIPREDSSGSRRRMGHVTREGPPTLRKLLTEAAWRGVREDETMKAACERLMRGDKGRKKLAVVALAHRLGRIMLAMLKSGEAYRGAAGGSAGTPAVPPAAAEIPTPPPAGTPEAAAAKDAAGSPAP